MRIQTHTFMFIIIIYMYLPRGLAESNCNGTLHRGLAAKISFPRYSNGIDHDTLISGLEDMGGYKNKALAHMWRDIQGRNWWNGLLDPINPVLKAEILRYGDFAQFCYDVFDSKLCMNDYGGCKYSLDDNFAVSYGYEVTKYLYAETDIILGRPIKRSVWIGFIAVCTDAQEIQRQGRRDILIAWRGTQTSREWIQDITDFLVPYRLSSTALVKDDGVRVEKGFLNCYTSVGQDSRCARETVRSEIIRLVDEYRDENLSVTLTGHSLGAALATLSSYDIKQILMAHSPARPIPVTVFAFASPRVGNRAFARRLKELGVKVLRLVNKNDFVPKVPGLLLNEKSFEWFSKMFDLLPWAYFHVGAQIVFNNDASLLTLLKNIYNPASAHNLELYLHLIDGYVGKGEPLISWGRNPALLNNSCDLLIQDVGVPLVGRSSNCSTEIKFITLDNDMK